MKKRTVPELFSTQN